MYLSIFWDPSQIEGEAQMQSMLQELEEAESGATWKRYVCVELNMSAI